MNVEAARVQAAAPRAPDRGAQAFVWSVWLLMALVCLACLAQYGRNVPQTEDWTLVPALTGNEPHVLQGLWAQNNEHRVPFPKAVLLGLLRLTHGDFRVGMALNVLLLVATAAVLVHLARAVRGGVTRYADAFFPIGLLHLGNWDNLFWGWQATQVIPTVLVLAMLYLLVRMPGFPTAGGAVAGATILVLLPLSGANGLFFAPFFACWAAYCGMRRWRSDDPADAPRWTAGLLIAAAAVALSSSGLYFVGYERPSWVPPNPGLQPTILAAAQFVAVGFGPIARASWALSIGAALAVLVPSLALAVRAARISRGTERIRSLGILVFAISFAAFALVLGWGRAGVIDVYRSWPIRYSLLAFPGLVAAFFVWELYGGRRWRGVVQNGLFAAMFVLVPLNTIPGIWWRDWYRDGTREVLRDLRAGASASELAREHGEFLNHSLVPGQLAELMRMLKGAGMSPWLQLRDAPSTPGGRLASQEIRYRRADAAEVFLVWGIDGWQTLAEGVLPAGTVIEKGLMHTPMTRSTGEFVGTIRAPVGATLDYGFLTTREADGAEASTWDGGYTADLGPRNAVIEREAGRAPPEVDPGPRPDSRALVLQEFRYRLPGAGEVYLVWGVDGWQAVPAAAEAGRTVVEDQVMRTLMRRDGDAFVAIVRAPAGSAFDYGFLITDRRGIFDLASPQWEERIDHPRAVAGGRPIDIRASGELPDEWQEVRVRWRKALLGLALLMSCWAVLYVALGFVENRRLRVVARRGAAG